MTTLSDLTASYKEVRKRLYDAGLARQRRLAVMQPTRLVVVKPVVTDESRKRRLTTLYDKWAARLGYVLTPYKRPTLNMIVQQVADKHGLPPAEIMSLSQQRPIAQARHEVMYRARHETLYSTSYIGRFLNRDHTTVIYGIKCHQRMLAKRLAREP